MRSARLRIERSLRSENGQSLVLAILIMMVVTIAAGSVAELITSTQNTSSNERQGARALSAADAGLDLGANAVAVEFNPPAALPVGVQTRAGTAAVDGYNLTWGAVYAPGLAAAPGIWTVSSLATSSNGKISRRLQEQVTSKVSTLPGAPSAFYSYGLVSWGTANPDWKNADGTLKSGSTICARPNVSWITNSAAVTVPYWTNGDVCVSGGSNPSIGNPASVTGPTSPDRISAHIGGGFYEDNVDPAIGGSSYASHNGPLKSVFVGNAGCVTNAGGWAPISCALNPAGGSPNSGTASGVWADDYTGASDPSPAPTKPVFGTAEEIGYYNKYAVSSVPGQAQKCINVGGSSPFTDTDAGTTPNTRLSGTSGTTTIDLVQQAGSTPWDCQTANGELSWAPGSPGIFTISGGFFIDANVVYGYRHALYKGSGTLYVDGTVFFQSGGWNLCAWTHAGQTNCDAAWTGAAGQNVLELVAVNHANLNQVPLTAIGFDINYSSNGASEFQGIAYTNGTFATGHGGVMAGSTISDYSRLQGDGQFQVTQGPPPDSVAGVTTLTVYTWTVSPSTWRQCPASTPCTPLP